MIVLDIHKFIIEVLQCEVVTEDLEDIKECNRPRIPIFFPLEGMLIKVVEVGVCDDQ